ncbi:MAG: hypothetical protein EXR35_00185 [Limnohabitans sp.]|nr:hypothetical protein [Limnohabitans sp.]
MTLSTLQGINLSAEQLSQSLQLKTTEMPVASTSTNEKTPAVDPMVLWGALTQQFTQITDKTVQDLQTHAAATAVKAEPQKATRNKRSAVTPKKQTIKGVRKT